MIGKTLGRYRVFKEIGRGGMGVVFKAEDIKLMKYHKVTDEIQPDWDLRGALQIVDWAREIISTLEEREELPQFAPTSSFKQQPVK